MTFVQQRKIIGRIPIVVAEKELDFCGHRYGRLDAGVSVQSLTQVLRNGKFVDGLDWSTIGRCSHMTCISILLQ